MNSAWRAFTPSSTSVVLMTSNTAPATAHASGLPPYVVPCTPTRERARDVVVVSSAPIGKPPPRPLALVRMSGTTPFCMYEKSAPVRPMPLWISSRIRSASCAVHSRRAACRNSGVPGVMPPSPCIGSRITAQISSPLRGELGSSAATSLYGTCVNAGRIGSEARRVFRLAAGGDREQRAAVERVQRRDHAEFLRRRSGRAHSGARASARPRWPRRRSCRRTRARRTCGRRAASRAAAPARW